MDTLLVERADGIVTVTLNRPEKKNAVDFHLWRGLLDTFEEIAERPEDRVMILTGAGGDFCSGADLTDLVHDTRHRLVMMRHISDAALALHRIPQPIIAKVRGVAVGAGCNMALGCDLVVASEEARFSEIFARRGLSLDFGGSWLLPRAVGLHKAKELALLAEVIPAHDALALGIVNRVVPSAELDAFVADWAARMAAGPPLALSMTKTMLNTSFETSMDQALEDEARCQTVNFSTGDVAEALKAFAERREPRFEGR